MRGIFGGILRRTGFDLVRRTTVAAEHLAEALRGYSDAERQIISAATPFTMTSAERMAALLNATTHLTKNQIPGDIAECGVWRGGSMMIVALTLLAYGDRTRSLYLYDTYEGMSAPTDQDKDVGGLSAEAQLQRDPRGTGIWCYASLEDVRANILSTGYPEDKVHFIKGKVEDTIPGTLPSKLSLLRLDTDWYVSTKHELLHLFPLLDARGILVIDDYGHWQGARKAVDEYFHERGEPVYLHRIDYTGRILVRNGR
jgi:O-methyltransferase